MKTTLVVLLLAGLSCTTGYSGPRFESPEDGVSFARPDGWEMSRERGTVVLTNSHKAATVAVRVVPRDGWSEPRDEHNVVPAVATFLAALPGARVSRPTELANGSYRGVSFDVEFTPPGKKGERYQRRHAVLVGPTRILHVFVTAPRGRLEEGRQAYERIVETIEEEG